MARVAANLPVALIEGAVGGERVADLEVSLCEGSVCVVSVKRVSNRMKNMKEENNRKNEEKGTEMVFLFGVWDSSVLSVSVH